VPAAAAAGSAAVGIRTACPARRATPRVARCNGPHAICQLCLSAAQGCTQQGVPGARTWPDHDEGRGRVCWQPEGGRQPAHAADHDAAGGQAREHRARRALVQPACAAGGAQRQRQGARGAGEGGGGGGGPQGVDPRRRARGRPPAPPPPPPPARAPPTQDVDALRRARGRHACSVRVAAPLRRQCRPHTRTCGRLVGHLAHGDGAAAGVCQRAAADGVVPVWGCRACSSRRARARGWVRQRQVARARACGAAARHGRTATAARSQQPPRLTVG
jgi:hypothetical protein